MYEVKITVEIPDLPEAINRLAEALTAERPQTVCNQNGANNQHINNAGVVSIDHSTFEEKVLATSENPTATASAPTTSAKAEPASAAQIGPALTSSPSEGKSYTLDDLSKAGAALIDQGKMPQLLELLKKYGVQAITQLDASVYTAFVEEMKALGAQL